MLERPPGGERAVLVRLDLPGEDAGPDPVDEFRELARSAGAEPVCVVGGRRRCPDPRLFVGQGKAEEIRGAAHEAGARIVIFDHALSPAQERNLERLLDCRVLDRVGLILDIFAQRASTHEGKLQVELAQLEHLSTRLVRGWTHLERQKGGIGLRGPGEKQLETDRRLLAVRVRHIRQRLDKVGRRRELSRRARERASAAVVSLVGYTNAGKSTLFNVLTASGVGARDRLFETLDPTLRRLPLPGARECVLADTVGFIRGLPHELVAAFRATLEETRRARLLLHVVDAGAPDRDERREQVLCVLRDIGAEHVPLLEVYNKLDRVESEPARRPRLERGPQGASRVWVSARTGEGLDLLRAAVCERLEGGVERFRLRLGSEEGRLRARLHELDLVTGEEADEHGWVLALQVHEGELGRLGRDPGLLARLEPLRASRERPRRVAAGRD